MRNILRSLILPIHQTFNISRTDPTPNVIRRWSAVAVNLAAVAINLAMAFTFSAPVRALASVLATRPIDRGNPPSESRPAPRQPPQVNLAALIDGLQSKYARMQGLAADFTQVYFGADGRTTSESGHLILKRPGKA